MQMQFMCRETVHRPFHRICIDLNIMIGEPDSVSHQYEQNKSQSYTYDYRDKIVLCMSDLITQKQNTELCRH